MAAAAQHGLALGGPSLSRPQRTACKPRLIGALASRKSNGNGLDQDRVQLEALLKQDISVQPEACIRCGSKGQVQCPTCVGSGLYIDSILESQGIIVQVECLGCGGSGNVMCPLCGGRGRS